VLLNLFKHNYKVRERGLTIEGLWISTGQIASLGGSLVLVRVLTEWLGPAQYGHLALGLSLVGLINQTVMGAIVAGVGRFYAIAAEQSDLGRYILSCRSIFIAASSLVLVVGLGLVAVLAASGLSLWTGFAIAATALAIVTGYTNSVSGIQNAARQRPAVALHSGLEAWLRILAVLALIFWLGATETVVVSGYIVAAILIAGSQTAFLTRFLAGQNAEIKHAAKTDWTSEIWKFAYPFSLWGVFTWAQQVSDRWALESFASTAEVGKYAVVYQLGYAPIGMLTGLLMALFGPVLYEKSGAGKDASRDFAVHKMSWAITKMTLLLTIAAFGLSLSFHDAVFRLLVAEPFRSVSYLLPWVVLAGGVFAAGQMLSLKLMAELRSRQLIRIKIITAVIGIIINFVGAWLYGVDGVVAGLVVFSVIYMAWSIRLAHKMPT
jgi:O-antigen/teichoic acid export membrane protein